MRYRELGLVALTYALAAVLWTWPLPFRLGSVLPFDPRFADSSTAPAYQSAWDFWWVGEALARGTSPFHCDSIHWPDGASLATHGLPFIWALLTLPLQYAGGVVLAVGLTHCLAPIAGALAAFALARSFGAGRASAWLGGFAWAFCPFFASVSLARLELAASPLPPLFLVAWTRWGASPPGRRRYVLAASTGLVAGLAWLSSPTAAGWLFVAALCWTAAVAWSTPRSRGACATTGHPSAGLASPLAWLAGLSMLALAGLPRWSAPAAVRGGQPEWGTVEPAAVEHPRLLAFVTPPGRHPFASRTATTRYGASLVEDGYGLRLVPTHGSVYIGVGFLTLVVLGAALDRRARPFALAGALALAIAWNPGGWIFDRLPAVADWFELDDSALWFPSALLLWIVCAALGSDALARRRAGTVGRIYLTLLVVLEFFVVPAATFAPDRPQAVQRLAAEPVRGSVAVLPVAARSHRSLLWQTMHQLPVAYAPLAGGPERLVRSWSIQAPDLLALAGGERELSLEGLAFDLELLDVQHLLVCSDEVDDFDRLASLLDGLTRWERGEVTGDVAWWYRPSF